MIKLEGFLFILSLTLTLFSFVDCAMRDETRLRKLPKWGWLLIIFFLGSIGSLAYLFVGRDGARQPRINRSKPKMLPPDDDPDFLRRL
jgi:hypothetical protein